MSSTQIPPPTSRSRSGPGASRAARALPLLLPLALAAALLVPALRRDAEEARFRATLQVFVAALESHRATHGSWPEASPATAAELVPALLREGHLERAPLNPASGAPYGSDPFEIDRIWYQIVEDGYVLEALDESGTRVLASAGTTRP